MEIVLLATTVISLTVAFVMSAAAWRLARDERARSAARIAALTAAAATDQDATLRAVPNPVPRPEPVPEAFSSSDPLAEFPAMGERAASARAATAPWSTSRVSIFATPAARVSTPAASSSPVPSPAARSGDLPLRDMGVREPAVREAAVGESFLGSAVAVPPSDGRQRGLAVAAAILFVVVAGGGYWTVFGKPAGAAEPGVAAAETSPLELVSLRHERKGPRLAVTGLVRNPDAGTSLEKLSAVVFLFDKQGAFLASGRADVDFKRLGPGDESPFVITVDAPGSVVRYRVSFRNDGGIVPHVDRRGQPQGAPVG